MFHVVAATKLPYHKEVVAPAGPVRHALTRCPPPQGIKLKLPDARVDNDLALHLYRDHAKEEYEGKTALHDKVAITETAAPAKYKLYLRGLA